MTAPAAGAPASTTFDLQLSDLQIFTGVSRFCTSIPLPELVRRLLRSWDVGAARLACMLASAVRYGQLAVRKIRKSPLDDVRPERPCAERDFFGLSEVVVRDRYY
jgi:hypothetical protein